MEALVAKWLTAQNIELADHVQTPYDLICSLCSNTLGKGRNMNKS